MISNRSSITSPSAYSVAFDSVLVSTSSGDGAGSEVALAHCLFTVPLSVWLLEGFFSAVPRELDEMAKIDGHSFAYFFFRVFCVFRG